MTSSTEVLSAEQIHTLADQCVKCGLCLPRCPTYQLERTETQGPRGRIALMDAIARSRDWLTPTAQRELDDCLGCRRCERACPAQVRYGQLLDATRARTVRLGLRARLYLRLVAAPRVLARALTAVRVLGARVLPGIARGLEPAVVIRARSSAAAVASVLPGCSGLALDTRGLAGLLALAEAQGQMLNVLPARCCGALAQHAGAPAMAQQLARTQAQDVDADAGSGPLLVWASGCLGFATAAQWQTTRPVESVLTWFARVLAPQLQPELQAGERIGWWSPCTLDTLAQAGAVLPAFWARVAPQRWVDLQGFGCCGAAGIRHLLDAPATSQRLSDRILDEALAARCTVLLSANPGCLHALRARARTLGLQLPVRHLFDWLAERCTSASAPGAPG